jgi:hypothetical protein
MMVGCVPVIIADEIELPYENVLVGLCTSCNSVDP